MTGRLSSQSPARKQQTEAGRYFACKQTEAGKPPCVSVGDGRAGCRKCKGKSADAGEAAAEETGRKDTVMKRAVGLTVRGTNPVIPADYPNPDVIRVGDVYYMLCATLHFLPGAVILRSYDLIRWEIASYVFETFEGTEEARMTNERSNYGYGMWAGSLRYHGGRFFVSFAAKETCKTYFYSSENVEGPWEKQCIDFYFHHGSLFLDEDGRIYLIFGHKEIWIREMRPDLSGLKPKGFARKLLSDTEDAWLSYEGSHFYKINGKYYLFVVRWPKTGTKRRLQMCFISESLDGEFQGKVVLDDDMGFFNSGVSQGGLVEANDGRWYSVMMQDRLAAGRAPVLVPVEWEGDVPVFGKEGKVPLTAESANNRPFYEYEPLYTSDAFYPEKDGSFRLKKQWQWNHEPNPALWEMLPDGGLRITTGKLCTNITQAVNTLTQRMFFPKSSVEVTLDASDLNEGDVAGLCALQGCYGMIAVTMELKRHYLIVIERENTEKNRNTTIADYMPGIITEKLLLSSSRVRLRLDVDFEKGRDTAEFFFLEEESGKWRKAGQEHKLYFGLDHFSGCRCGLGIYSTKKPGGSAVFQEFTYES